MDSGTTNEESGDSSEKESSENESEDEHESSIKKEIDPVSYDNDEEKK